ncbi:MAG: cobalamin-dependent protein [Cyanobacteriota/Melainabacteria group bacterium]
MFISLIRPSTVTSTDAAGQDAAPPVGLAYIAANLIQNNHKVEVVDALGEALDQYLPVDGVPKALQHGLSDQEVVNRISKDVDLICVSCMFSLEWPFTRNLINAIREAFPETPIAVGGEHVTACTEFVLKDCPAVSICAIGEGEETLVELANELEK